LARLGRGLREFGEDFERFGRWPGLPVDLDLDGRRLQGGAIFRDATDQQHHLARLALDLGR
jgi:hypothetical protein